MRKLTRSLWVAVLALGLAAVVAARPAVACDSDTKSDTHSSSDGK